VDNCSADCDVQVAASNAVPPQGSIPRSTRQKRLRKMAENGERPSKPQADTGLDIPA
jgi:hypothetical protein